MHKLNYIKKNIYANLFLKKYIKCVYNIKNIIQYKNKICQDNIMIIESDILRGILKYGTMKRNKLFGNKKLWWKKSS